MGVGGLRAGVGQDVFDGVEDQLLEFLDCLGELDERWEPAPRRLGEPAGQQGCGGGEVIGLEDRPELFLEQVGAVEQAVGGLDTGQGGALIGT